jgi:AAA domain
MKNTALSFTAFPIDSGADRLPAWKNQLSGDLASRLIKVPVLAFRKLCQLGVEHWNSVAQSVANSLKNSGFTEDELREVLTKSGEAYRDTVTEKDIEKVIAKAWDETTGKKSLWPCFDRPAFERLPKETESDFLEKHGRPETVEPWEVLNLLFKGDPLLCLAANPQETFHTQKLSEWKASGIQQNFIVPSPMTKQTGITKEGKESGRCNENTGERAYLVIESDELTRSEQWTLIAYLSGFAPLVMVLDTGNKSLHAWFRCDGKAEKDFMREAVRLGADKATWTACQLVRVPGGSHAKTRKPHEVLVFRPYESYPEIWRELVPKITESSPLIGGAIVKHHSEIQFDSTARDFVEDLLTERGLSVLYAPPGVGKSYFILDLAACVATGRHWRGKETKGGGVVYFCLEGVQGFKNRILALKKSSLLEDESPFFYVETSLNFLSETDVSAFIKIIGGSLPSSIELKLIVIDTLARSMTGGNENAGEDMSKAIDGANRLQDKLEAHVMLVHHSGKDLSKGSRGHSSLKGAADTEIELSKDENTGVICARVQKQKDLESGGCYPFKLNPITIGTNQRGKAVTACTVEHLNASQAPPRNSGGRKSKNETQDLLNLLPQANVTAWETAAREKAGIPRTRFFVLKKQLREGVDFEIDSEGSISVKSPSPETGLTP